MDLPSCAAGTMMSPELNLHHISSNFLIADCWRCSQVDLDGKEMDPHENDCIRC